MIKKITCFIFVLFLVLSNTIPISAKNIPSIELNKSVEFLSIYGKEYKFTTYTKDKLDYLILENGSRVDTFIYDQNINLVTLNGEKFGEFRTEYVSLMDVQGAVAAGATCSVPILSPLNDEQGYPAVYEICTTYVIEAYTGADLAIAGVAIVCKVAAAPIKNQLLAFLGLKVLPVYLNKALSTARQQYRSKNTMLNPYNGLYQYKKLYNSYFFYDNSRFSGPSRSVWWF